ncbi:MAG: hypothetical protein Ct9H90mP9_0730 [Pseudomonadota bacterium]|nr:MAG: hypothetical protein Ct9H90mP9_0730 [Pseudomonadota bacterium]
MKAVFGLSLPIMANIAEIVRGASSLSQPGQWEASESLAFSRRQTPLGDHPAPVLQTDDSPMDELVCDSDHGNPPGIPARGEEIVTLSRQGMEAEDNHPELLIPFYGFAPGDLLCLLLSDCTLDPRWKNVFR